MMNFKGGHIDQRFLLANLDPVAPATFFPFIYAASLCRTKRKAFEGAQSSEKMQAPHR